MSKLQDKFWQKRYDQMTDEIDNNLKSLYTWALILHETSIRRDQWISDKQSITGNKTSVMPVDKREKELAACIINYVVGGDLAIDGQPVFNKSQKPGSTSGDAEYESDIEVEFNKKVHNPKKMSSPDLQSYTDVVLSKQEEEQEELACHMDNRRIKSMRSQKNDLDCSQYLAKANDRTNDLCNLSNITETLEKAMQGEPEKQTTKRTTDQGFEEEKMKTRDNNIDECPPKTVNFLLDTTGEKYQHTDVTVPKEVADVTKYRFAGGDLHNISPGHMARNAPTVTPLMLLSKTAQNKLYSDIYAQATKNVLSTVGEKDISEEDREGLINKQGDRLLAQWEDSHRR
jgi:hypothetical protein